MSLRVVFSLNLDHRFYLLLLVVMQVIEQDRNSTMERKMGISTNGVACAVDIGYGNLKCVGGVAGSNEVQEIVLPAGAAPLSAMPRRSDNSADLKGGEHVLVNGMPWAAGVEQLHIQNRARMTHDDYPRTSEYEALYLAALARLGYKRIDVLVTGLPVSQFYAPAGQALVEDMKRMMQGRKLVNADTQVDVGTVLVVPQPLGTFFGLASEPKYASLAKEDHIRTLVVDPGFFSVDWVLMAGRSVLDQSSGTSKLATSVILERAAAKLTAELGREISRDQLDAAQRRGAPLLSVGFDRAHDYRSTLIQEATEVSDAVVGELKTSLRNAGPIDLVILTGGGSWLYEAAIRAAYPGATVATPADLVLGNARGYRAIASLKVAKDARQAAAA